MSTNVSKSSAFVGNVAAFLQNRNDNFNWFDDHNRCLVNVKLTFGEDVKKGETRYLGSFLGNGSDDDITTTVRKNGTLVIEIPNAADRSQPILQNNGITSKRVAQLEQTVETLLAAIKTAGVDLGDVAIYQGSPDGGAEPITAQRDDLPF